MIRGLREGWIGRMWENIHYLCICWRQLILAGVEVVLAWFGLYLGFFGGRGMYILYVGFACIYY